MMAAAYRLKSTLNGARRFGRGVALVGLLALTVDPALAQSDAQIPGLIVSVPSAETSPAAQSPSPGPGVNPLLRGTATGVQQAPPSRAKQRPVKKQRRPAKKVAKRSQPKAQRVPRRKHGVAVLVNDEPITHHEIDQRARLMMVQANVNKTARAKFQSLIKQKSVNNQLRSLLKETIDANPGKSREQILAKFERKKKTFAASLRARALSSARSGLLPQFRKKAKKQLIEERLKMQEAKRLKTLASWKDVDGAIANIAKRNKVDVKTFLGRLGTGGARSTTFKNKIRADMSWSGVVRRRYGHTIAVSLADIDRHANTASGESATKLKLHQ
ncbi:MAG: SurA N-terminal domain-containing protein, partial [Hyphomicrobiaceae bacterium]